MRQCSCALFVRDGRLLLGRRSPAKSFYPGVWDLIGGHSRPGETPEAALLREVEEEIGWSVVPMDFRLDTLKQSLQSAVEGMSTEQLSWHLPGKWCAAEVLEHLYLTYTGTTRGLEKVITRGAPLATKPSVAKRVLTFVVTKLRYMPAGREAPPIVQPKGLSPEQVRNEIWSKLAAMDAIIAQCEARFGRHVKLLDHPILGALNAAEWRMLHLVHGRHHQKQLLRLRERSGSSAVVRSQSAQPR